MNYSYYQNVSKQFFLKMLFSILFLFLTTNIFPQNRNTILNSRYQNTIKLLSRLSDNNIIWSGQSGNDFIRRINRALVNATNLKTTSDVMIYKAASSLIKDLSEEQFIILCGGKSTGVTYTGTYTDTMQLLELGISPELLIAILNEVRNVEFSDMYAARLKDMLNLTNNEAASLSGIIKNQSNFLDKPVSYTNPEIERLLESIKVRKQQEEDSKKEREAAEATAKREQEAADAAARQEKILAEEAARKKWQESPEGKAEEVARMQREELDKAKRKKQEWIDGDSNSKILVGYIYDPILPIGLQLGFIGERWGGYASVAIGLGLFDSEYKNLPKTDVTYGYYLLDQLEIKKIMDIDFSFGIYYRIINNFFIDAGLGFYFYNTYGLYNIREAGKPYDPNSKPVWHEIVGNDGSGLLTGFSFKAGLMYTYKWFYLKAGYKHFLDIYDSIPSFYAGGGVSIYLN